HDVPRLANTRWTEGPEVPTRARMHVLRADPISEVGDGQRQRDRTEHRCHTHDGVQQVERAWRGPEAPGERPLFPAQPKPARDTRKRHELVPFGGVAEVSDHIGRHEHIDRGAHLVQPAKDVEGMMLESREWLRGKQKVKGYTVRHRIATSHSRKLAEERGHRPTRALARNAQAPHAARAST